MSPDLTLRLAVPGDAPAITDLIRLSVNGLQAADYSPEQRRAAIGQVFLVDRGLVADGSYYVVAARDGRLVGAGGWSSRRALHGAHTHGDTGERIDPGTDPARIRAFFVDPDFARGGVASAILAASEAAARAAGFAHAVLGATLTGVPFYARRGYVECAREETRLSNRETITIVHMARPLADEAGAARG